MHFYGVLLGQCSNTELHARDTSDRLYLKATRFLSLFFRASFQADSSLYPTSVQWLMNMSYQGTGYVTFMDSGFLR